MNKPAMRVTHLVLWLSIALLCGCENGSVVFTEEARAAEKAINRKRGEARALAFKDCMELAAKMPRQADDDVSDIVDSCSNQSYYMTSYVD